MNHILNNDFYTVTISELGAEMISVKGSDLKELVWQNPTDEFWGGHAPLLFPVCGRLKDSRYTYRGKSYDMDGHGFIAKRTFTVKEKTDSSITLVYTPDEKTKAIYPFDFTLSAHYRLEGDSIIFTATVENTGSDTLPYMFGWHPGFNIPTDNGLDIEDYYLDFAGCERLIRTPLQNGCFACPYGEDYPLDGGKYKLCEEEIYKNDTLIFSSHKNRVKFYADESKFYIDMSWSENLPALCIWKEDDNRAKFICIEPWTGTPADGEADENFDTREMNRLLPGARDVFSYSLKFGL